MYKQIFFWIFEKSQKNHVFYVKRENTPIVIRETAKSANVIR